MNKSSTNHEKIVKKSLNILQKSLKNEEKTCFPLQPEAHFPKDDISENKEKTKAQLLAVTSNHYKSIYTKAQRFVPLTTLSKDNSNHYKSVYIKAQRFVPLTALSKVSSNHYKNIYIKAQRFVPLATLSKVNSNYYKNIYIKNHKKYH